MNRYIYRSFFFLLSIALVACSKDSETSVSSDCYISSFSLGTLTRTVIDSEGTASEVSYNGSYYPMSINQITGEITNTIPLLTNTDLSSVTASISAVGEVVFTTQGGEPTYYTTSTYIDFSNPVKFQVYATDGSGYREYTVTVRMRDKDAGSYDEWKSIDGTVLTGKKERRALPWNDGILLMTTDAAGDLYATPLTGTTWGTENPCTGAVGAQVESLQNFDGKLWMNTTDGHLVTSADGTNWTPLTQNQTGDEVTLVAASSQALYARLHNATADPADWIGRSTDGQSWTAESLDRSINLFPTTSASVSYTLNGAPYVLVAGKTADEQVTVWRKDEKNDESWTLYETDKTSFDLPWRVGMILLRYSGKLIAMSGNETTTYVSENNGVVWKNYQELKLPLTGSDFSATVFDKYIYLFAGEEARYTKINE